MQTSYSLCNYWKAYSKNYRFINYHKPIVFDPIWRNSTQANQTGRELVNFDLNCSRHIQINSKQRHANPIRSKLVEKRLHWPAYSRLELIEIRIELQLFHYVQITQRDCQLHIVDHAYALYIREILDLWISKCDAIHATIIPVCIKKKHGLWNFRSN